MFRVCVACVLFAACAPAHVVVRSNHYRVFVPPNWRVAEQTDASDQATVLQVPAAATSTGGETLELRLYAWVAPKPAGDPVDEAVKRLAGAEGPELRTAAAVDETRCGARARTFWLFGEPHVAAQLRRRSGDHLIVTAGHASGSLVAVVGTVRDAPSFCDDIGTMEAAIASLRTALADSADLARVPDNAILLPGSPRGSSVALPSPDQPLVP